MFQGILSAIAFLTIIPQKRGWGVTSWTLSCFPFAGLLSGGVMLITHLVLNYVFPGKPGITAGGVLLGYIILTGGLHLDGLSDTFDGLMSTKTEKTDILHVLEDSHAGAGGIIAIVMDILLKYTLITCIPAGLLPFALCVFPVVSRWSMVLSMLVSKPAKNAGLGYSFISNAGAWNFALATAFSILITIFFVPWTAVILLFASSALIVSLWTIFLNRRFGGMTGDTLGSVNEISEIVSLAVIAGTAAGKVL